MQTQSSQHRAEVWIDGASDYVKEAGALLAKFKDVLGPVSGGPAAAQPPPAPASSQGGTGGLPPVQASPATAAGRTNGVATAGDDAGYEEDGPKVFEPEVQLDKSSTVIFKSKAKLYLRGEDKVLLQVVCTILHHLLKLLVPVVGWLISSAERCLAHV